ncbi:MAG: lipase [Proteobacteria bacterium]|nr:lipase [Pseudomonadota bacterium]
MSALRLVFSTLAVCTSIFASASPLPNNSGMSRLPSGAEAGDQALSPFYAWNAALPKGPGVMLRTEPMTAQPEFTQASEMKRILYTSTDARWGSGVIPVSGTLYLPKGVMPSGGWPILAWGHGTLGVADQCAPSWKLHRPRDASYLNRWLEQGFAVVATDYQGLGGPGPHPYLFWEAEGRSILDSVRAALAAYPDRLANQIVVSGQSQGSGSSLGASRVAPTYAPDLHLVATIATGIVPSFPQNGSNVWRLTEHLGPRFTMLRLVGGAIPDNGIPASNLVTPKGQALLEMASKTCVDELRGAEQQLGITAENAFTMDAAALQAKLTPSTDMTAVRLPAPLFLGTGLSDRSVPPKHQHAVAVALCSAGNPLTWRTYHGTTHNGIVNAAFNDELAFVRQAIAGTPTASNCGAIVAPGEPEKPTEGVLFND